MNMEYFILFLMITNIILSSTNIRFLTTNQECLSHIPNCIQCSSSFTVCHKCKDGFKLSSDQTQCKDSKKKNTLKIIISIIIPVIIIALSIFLILFIRIKLKKLPKKHSAASNKKTTLSIISQISKMSNSPQHNTDHQFTISKYTDVSIKNKQPQTMESQCNVTQKLSGCHSNMNLMPPHMNSESCISNGIVHMGDKNSKYYSNKTKGCYDMMGRNNFITDIRINKMKQPYVEKGKHCKNENCVDTNMQNVLKCVKCGSRNVYCTLSCNCNLCLEHFKEFACSPNRKYVCEKHCTEIYTQDVATPKIIPSLLINSTILSKIN